MHICQVFLRVHVMMLLQAAQGGPIHFEILFTQHGNVRFRDAELLTHVLRHPCLDGLPETRRGGVKGIVKVKE